MRVRFYTVFIYLHFSHLFTLVQFNELSQTSLEHAQNFLTATFLSKKDEVLLPACEEDGKVNLQKQLKNPISKWTLSLDNTNKNRNKITGTAIRQKRIQRKSFILKKWNEEDLMKKEIGGGVSSTFAAPVYLQ